MKLIHLFTLTAVLFLLSCSTTSRLSSTANSAPKPKAVEPEIGMSLSEFRGICGWLESDDGQKELKTAAGDQVTYEYTPRSHTKKGCSGSFTFNNSVLAMIYHD